MAAQHLLAQSGRGLAPIQRKAPFCHHPQPGLHRRHPLHPLGVAGGRDVPPRVGMGEDQHASALLGLASQGHGQRFIRAGQVDHHHLFPFADNDRVDRVPRSFRKSALSK